jgi:predicted nucleotidyltransferase
MKNNINPEYKQDILKVIHYHFPEAKVTLFGSQARVTNRPGADVDIAIDIGKPIKLREMSRARVTLENLAIPLEVDLVDMNCIPQELKDIIQQEGIVWKG